MKPVFLPMLVALAALAGCNQPPRAPTMAGTAAGTCDDTASAAARQIAGSGCPAGASQGVATIAGCDTKGSPQIAYRGIPMGTVGDPVARPIAPGGTTNSCP